MNSGIGQAYRTRSDRGLTWIRHGGAMPTSLPAGPDPNAVVRYIIETYPETDVVDAMNAWFFSLDPEKHWPNYATLVTTDEHDDASDLSRPGAYRLNLGVDRATFDRIAQANAKPDYTAFDRPLPTPSTPTSSGSRSSTRATRPSPSSSCRSSRSRTTDWRRREPDTPADAALPFRVGWRDGERTA